MAAPSTIAIAGAGIGGMTAALALARRGFSVLLIERARVLEEAGAGIQLSPNASRILLELGLGPLIEEDCVEPGGVRVRVARSGKTLATIPLDGARARYGAPYWVVHRADLQSALLQAVQAQPRIALRLGSPVLDYALSAGGVTVMSERAGARAQNDCAALIGADGVRSQIRRRFAPQAALRFAGRCAFRLTVQAEDVPASMAAHDVGLWLGSGTHLVHYPVHGGRAVNFVAVADDPAENGGWNTTVSTADVLRHFRAGRWHRDVTDFIGSTTGWAKWSLVLTRGLPARGEGPVTLLGDAAHPTLPHLAQGGAMAIEDAAVLAQECAAADDFASALRRYETRRRYRVWRMVTQARLNGFAYHAPWPISPLRNLAIRVLSGTGLLHSHDWLYGWHADA